MVMVIMVQKESQVRYTDGRAGSRPGGEERIQSGQELVQEEGQASATAAGSSKKKAKRRSRFTAWWFARKALVLAMFAAALLGGLYVGFVILGKGSMDDAFSIASYRHIYDLIFSDS